MNKLLSCRQGRRRHHLCKQRGVHPVRGGAVSHPAPGSRAHRSFDQSRSEINAPARSAQSKKSHARPSGAAWDFFHFRSAVRQVPGSCCQPLPHDGGGKGRGPAFSGCQTDGGGALAPLLWVGLCAGQRVPWLDADKADRLCQRAPDQLVRKILNIADDVPPAVFFINAQRSGPQPRHAKAVVGK